MTGGWARRGVLALGAVVLVVIALGVGWVIPSQPLAGAAVAGAVLLLGITAAEPAAIPLVAMPLLIVIKRLSIGGVDLSVSDAALGVATLGALVFAPRPFSPGLRNLLWLNALYQFATLFTVLTNPFEANTVEWIHAWMLISGSLLVGWTIGRRGLARVGTVALLSACLALALITIVQGAVQWARGDLSPVYVTWPYPMHKNMVGTVLGLAATLLFARPPWLRWGHAGVTVAVALLLSGLALTQSRQAIVAVGVAFVFVAYRRGFRGRGLVALTVLPVMGFVATLVQDQVESGNRFNSAFQRLAWFQEALNAWSASPWVGQGLRFWYRADAPLRIQPPNAELEVLAAAGAVGLVAFVVWLGGSLASLLRLPRDYGTVAVAMLGGRVVQGQFDIFWVGTQLPMVMAVVGMALGSLDFTRLSVTPWDAGRAAPAPPPVQRQEAPT